MAVHHAKIRKTPHAGQHNPEQSVPSSIPADLHLFVLLELYSNPVADSGLCTIRGTRGVHTYLSMARRYPREHDGHRKQWEQFMKMHII